MSETTTTPNAGGTEGGETPTTDEGFKPITSQEDLNRIIADRVARERAKVADYKDLKAKAARLDEIEAANKSEVEKAAERIAALEADNQRIQSEALRSRIQAKFGISDDDAALFLTGTDEETLTLQGQRLSARDADRKTTGNIAPREGHTPKAGGDDETRAFARDLFNRAKAE